MNKKRAMRDFGRDQVLEQPEQEPVGWLDAEMSQAYTVDELADASGTGFLPLYTAPPKKQWVGLTDEEHAQIAIDSGCASADWIDYAKKIEAKLKERNT